MKKIILLLTLVSLEASAAGWESLIQNLTQNRAELETLSKETDSLQKEKQNDLDQWTQRKIELESQVQREKLRELQITEKIKRAQSRVKSEGKSDPLAQKKLLTWIDGLEKWVQSSIPFQTNSRLQTLKNFRERIDQGQESLEFVLADLWAFMESQVKMAQTNEFTITDIDVDGKTQKVEIARIGTQSLFAVTPDGKTLKAKKVNNQWTWIPVGSGNEETSVQLLVKNLKSKNYTGYYYLPVDKKEQMGASL